MGKMSEEHRENFLAKTRYGYLTTLTSDGAPRSVPIWFDWDGHKVRIFTGTESPKAKRIRHDPRVTMLVSNNIGEPESWVAFDGKATIYSDEAIGIFLDKLAAKYWDLSDPKHKATLASWKANAEQLCVIELVPTRIRTYVD